MDIKEGNYIDIVSNVTSTIHFRHYNKIKFQNFRGETVIINWKICIALL